MADQSTEIMHTKNSERVVDAKMKTRHEKDAEPIREIAEMGLSSPVGDVDESTTSNAMEIVRQDGMGTVNRDFDVTVRWTVLTAPALYDEG